MTERSYLNKSWPEMTNQELIWAFEHWSAIVATAPGWASAYQVEQFRVAARNEILRRLEKETSE